MHLVRATLAIFLLGKIVHADPPKIDAFFPPGGRQGTTFTITSTVKDAPDTAWWTDAPGVTFSPTDKPEESHVSISAKTPAGLYQVARLNAEGVSESRWFTVGKLPEISEVEPNDEGGTRQLIASLPVCINARLDKANDVDGYQIPLNAGQTLVAMIEAYSIGSAVDALVHILNPQGQRIFTASDDRNLDPFCAFTAPADGTYTLQIAGFAHPPQANINFTGSAATVYRLHLSTGPVVTHFHPASVSTTEPTNVTLQGYNLDPAKTAFIIDPKTLRPSDNGTLVDVPESLVPLQAVTTTTAPGIELEPNNTQEQATPVKEGTIGGIISGANDSDRFAIEMKTGQRLQARIFSKSLGLPLDPAIKIEGPDGKQMAENDDYNALPDPLIQWTAAVDGPHQIIVSDTLQQGGPRHHYVLEITTPEPELEITLADAKPIVLAAGESIAVKLTINRLNGYKESLVARASQLPSGVRAEDVTIGESDKEVELKLTAAHNAPIANMLIALTVWSQPPPPANPEDQTTPPGKEWMFPATISLRGELLRGTSLLDKTIHKWLTVTAEK
jgi:hypothetical protein